MGTTIKSKAFANTKKTSKGKYKSKPLLSNTRKPSDLTISEWQSGLRRQIAERSSFKISNIGGGLAYSDYTVLNNATKNSYKVALRSSDNQLNYCSCLDFKTNQLGTCKHIEAVLLYVHKNPLKRKALKDPYTTAYSSMYINYSCPKKGYVSNRHR